MGSHVALMFQLYKPLIDYMIRNVIMQVKADSYA